MKTSYDPADPTSRGLQITDSIQAKLVAAQVERAKQPPSADETALLNSLRSIPRQELSVQAAKLKVIEDARLAAIARAVARIPEDAT